MWVTEPQWIRKRTFIIAMSISQQRRAQISQAAAATALSLKRLLRSEVRFQPTLSSLDLPHTHTHTHTHTHKHIRLYSCTWSIQWQESFINAASALSHPSYTLYCTSYSMCMQLHTYTQRKRKQNTKDVCWQMCKVFLDIQRRKQTIEHQRLSEIGNDWGTLLRLQ